MLEVSNSLRGTGTIPAFAFAQQLAPHDGLRSARQSSCRTSVMRAAERDLGTAHTSAKGSTIARVLLGLALVASTALLHPPPALASTDFGMGFDLKGEKPILGTAAGGRFLRLCEVAGCVSSGDEVGSSAYVPPWTFNNDGLLLSTGGAGAARQTALADLLNALAAEKINVVSHSADYIRAEAGNFLGSVDDVEFLLSQDGRSVEVKSSPRRGIPALPGLAGDQKARLQKVLARIKATEGGGAWRESQRVCSTFRYDMKSGTGRATDGSEQETQAMGEFDYCDTPNSPVFRGAFGQGGA
mmetsp:Transcript_13296/g.32299  ORF Transcript_13296/g.32299 Transcript_13296/m.32299 type:complete len:299 (-) Transcript_13296:42-938(-)